MIPKVIHYCWFGGNPLPSLAVKCIESWKKYCPDYEIKEWNESNFDLECCDYVKEAYDAKKWAFITDFVRLYVLFHEGGIYMDTDVEVIKSLDIFLINNGFSGFETDHSIPTGIMAGEKNHPLLGRLLGYYKNRHFLNLDGSFDLTTNVEIITEICAPLGLKLNGKKQKILDFVFYPKEVFCPKNYETGIIERTDRTYTIHHFSGSWHTEKEKDIRKKEEWLYRKLGRWAVRLYSLPRRVYGKIKDVGLKRALHITLTRLVKHKRGR